MISIILTIHNKQELVKPVLEGILKNASKTVTEVIIVMDGCTDNSLQEIQKILLQQIRPDINIKVLYTPDVFETKANNVGLKECAGEYAIIVQDDQVILEPGYDVLLMLPFLKVPNIFAVSGRLAHDNTTANNKLKYTNLAGAEHGNVPRGTFEIRDICIRGPLMLDMVWVKALNYLDGSFAPYIYDDHDLCYRAWKQLHKRCGVFPITFESKPEWGTTRQKNFQFWKETHDRNEQQLIRRHGDMMTSVDDTSTFTPINRTIKIF